MPQAAPTPVPTERLHLAMPPQHSSPEEARRHRKERLAAALRLFGRMGFEEGVAGHITARDPEFTDCCWVNPFGMPFGHVAVSDLILVNQDGQVLEGRRHVNQAAFVVHSRVHAARPDVVAVVHSHTTHGRALSALGELLDPITQDACAFYEDHALLDRYTGVTVDEEEGTRIASALGPHKGVILRNHGLLTVGDSVDSAAWWFLQMEKACEIQLAAKAAGKPVLIDHKSAVATREQLGSDLVAWINYQPLYTSITRDEPGLLT
ncbi:class II aldolase/adducin family protein [Streptomyces sp. NBC_01186]|uniref:class II aldolase/adducin family protein n=1 Tax=unclassified Streptomyces TaxID=2593676 RepID=UPI002DDA0FC3|nr:MULTISPECIES: class II aldolase/adducin family protein [unclassified Streptomyces]WSB77249.1 class II aldolase/adducin family protein [Streptomyces sp. NBC_01775]WSS14486.1 class II aldolase/adducin family protein [Streptomyces sp. NBC_01186]